MLVHRLAGNRPSISSSCFERNTFITCSYEPPFIRDSSLGSMQRFQTSYNSHLHNTDNSLMRTPGSVPKVFLNVSFTVLNVVALFTSYFFRSV